jgi:hypothetical protein
VTNVLGPVLDGGVLNLMVSEKSVAIPVFRLSFNLFSPLLLLHDGNRATGGPVFNELAVRLTETGHKLPTTGSATGFDDQLPR